MSDLWGGRFRAALDLDLRRFSSSLSVDRRLVRQDLACSRAHADALADAGLLPAPDRQSLLDAMAKLEAEIDDGTFPPDPATVAELPEDIHTAVENRLVELCGDAARRLHAGRSRNDQVATDVLLWLRDASAEVVSSVRGVARALVDQAEVHRDTVIYAYTHLQRAQPVSLAHHLLAHVEALRRDLERLADAARRADRSPLGAGACAGSTLPLDREATARRLGFARVAIHSIDAVSDRDWAIEFASACALVMTHFSRLAEELVLWSTPEFGMVTLGDAWCTGSSMLPQKRNPDGAELVRGKTARVHARLFALHELLKGLPLAYNRDLQEDKEALFDVADTTRDCARMLAGMLAGARFHAARAVGPDFSLATDLAEELVRRGVPFRRAHERVGRLVAACEADGRGLEAATTDELLQAGLAEMDRAALTPHGSLAAKRTLGSTHPDEVARALVAARSWV